MRLSSADDHEISPAIYENGQGLSIKLGSDWGGSSIARVADLLQFWPQ
jgi:hypothetical protein